MNKPALSYRAGAYWARLPTGVRLGAIGATALLAIAFVSVARSPAPPAAQAPPQETPSQVRAKILDAQCTTGLPAVLKMAQDQIAAGNAPAARATLALCNGYPLNADFKTSAANAQASILALEKKQDEASAARKRAEGVQIGMTQSDVLASSWGKPQKINTTTTARGTREQWVYGGHNYLYFEDGRLTAIQN